MHVCLASAVLRFSHFPLGLRISLDFYAQPQSTASVLITHHPENQLKITGKISLVFLKLLFWKVVDFLSKYITSKKSIIFGNNKL